MLCKGTIQENNRSIPCWLPADPVSLFQLCRRCYFHHITHVLDSLTREYSGGNLHPRHEILLENTVFLNELLHPAREQALLNLLFSVYKNNKVQFSILIERLKQRSTFPILLTKRIQNHHEGTRCHMYRVLLKNNSLYKSEDLCWNCWSCIAWAIKQNDTRIFSMFRKSFQTQILGLTFEKFQEIGSKYILDILTTLYIQKEFFLLKSVLQHFFVEFPLEDVKRFYSLFFQQTGVFSLLFNKDEVTNLPLPLQDGVVMQEFKKKLKNHIKQKTDLFKEELVMRTWHPSRFVTWCLDIEEQQEFRDMPEEDQLPQQVEFQEM